MMEATMQEPYEDVAGTDTNPGAREWQEAGGDAAVRKAEREAKRLAAQASRTMKEAKEKVGAAYDRTAEQAGRMYRGARGYAQENPGTAAAITFAAGMGLGLMAARQSGFRAYRRGLVPVIAVALARTVLDVLDEEH
jgi:ElaB/YqjD/DUF883 family membrane-anchored ribosome-binding protein